MGRVARYKKIKACDPFAKGGNKRKTIGGETVWGIGDDGRKAKKRSRTAEKLRAQRKRKTKLDKFTDRAFDAPPADGDEFNMQDLLGSVKKSRSDEPINEIIRVSIPSATNVTHAINDSLSTPTQMPTRPASNNLQEETSINRLLKLEQQVQPSKSIHQPRMEHESKNAYRKRVANETRRIIRRETMEAHNPDKRKRKKEFLNNKKKTKKGGLQHAYRFGGEDEDNGDQMDDKHPVSNTLVTGEQAYAKRALETQVQFGEQAERPPSFKQLPRKATPRKAAKNVANNHSGMDEADVQAEQAEMELMRRKVRAHFPRGTQNKHCPKANVPRNSSNAFACTRMRGERRPDQARYHRESLRICLHSQLLSQFDKQSMKDPMHSKKRLSMMAYLSRPTFRGGSVSSNKLTNDATWHGSSLSVSDLFVDVNKENTPRDKKILDDDPCTMDASANALARAVTYLKGRSRKLSVTSSSSTCSSGSSIFDSKTTAASTQEETDLFHSKLNQCDSQALPILRQKRAHLAPILCYESDCEERPEMQSKKHSLADLLDYSSSAELQAADCGLQCRMEALLIQQQLLGPCHPDVTFLASHIRMHHRRQSSAASTGSSNDGSSSSYEGF
ncbi:hypothetical protein MPSEU_000576200 [Mayamaea pseudoterrestris]|nr:hypothetical protein MPSEU_000576200 [Mayamaea pseudoterrestris]